MALQVKTVILGIRSITSIFTLPLCNPEPSIVRIRSLLMTIKELATIKVLDFDEAMTSKRWLSTIECYGGIGLEGRRGLEGCTC